MRFSVDLELFHGPLDLLLYLVRKHELDVTDIPIARVADQYLAYLAVLEQVDVDAVGDFLEVASLLIEIKSRMVLPSDEEVVEELEDPRHELVRRLLEYKEFRDAASMLDEHSRRWRDRYPRMAAERPAAQVDPQQQPIQQIELWDLVSAFGRVLKERSLTHSTEKIRYDDTPIHVFMRRIDDRLHRDGRTPFSSFFDSAVHRSTMVGMFLAVLQLMRYEHARAEQAELFEEIWLEPGAVPLADEIDDVAEYEHGSASRDA
jgi:segregation and condensation protein A